MRSTPRPTPIPIVLDPPPNVVKVTTMGTFAQALEFLENTPEFGFDIETTPLKDFWFRRIRTIQFGNGSVQFVIDLRAFASADDLFACQGEYGVHLDKASSIKYIIEKLSPYLCSDKRIKVGVNLGFEYMCLYWSFGLRTYGFYDCMLAEKCIWAGMPYPASLKHYEYFSMEQMMLRYFNVTIDKQYQTSFNLEDELIDGQWDYAALDVRTPLGIKAFQTLIATKETPATLRKKGRTVPAEVLEYIPDILLGDDLREIIQIENEAIGSFIDMHLHGENMDIPRWQARVDKAKVRYAEVIKALDKIFLPIVGSKLEAVDDAYIDQLEAEWKGLRDNPEDVEIELKVRISKLKREVKKDPTLHPELTELQASLSLLEEVRLTKKEKIKAVHSELKKKRTKINNLAKDCEGEALINYGSDAQVRHCLNENFKGLEKLPAMDDDTLEMYDSYRVIKLIREYHGLAKDIGTYGESWITRWKSGPCKAEGWLHPMDGKLHCEFNQYDAETGRTSSEKPNGQNLPQDKEVRSSFIADPPNENIRISNCCEADTFVNSKLFDGYYGAICDNCGKPCETHAEESVLITADMSGAELRIIAEDSGDEIWIGAFERDEDVHSVGTELLYEVEWPMDTLKSILKPDGWTLEDCKKEVVKIIYNEDGKEKKLGPCAYFALKSNGEPAREKCDCPQHNARRNENKATNFLLAYGGQAGTLAKRLKKTFKEAKALMEKHRQKNPKIWAYLEKSGNDAQLKEKAFDLFGRRRALPKPTYEQAKQNCKEWKEEQLRLKPDQAEKNLNAFIQVHGRKPTEEEEFDLTHREPYANEISNSYYQMNNGVGRQGKNMRIQGTNASIIKKAQGCGYAADGTPFLWHTLPTYRARIVKMVHDELVVNCPKRYAEQVAALIGEAFRKAAALKMTKVVMKFDYKIGPHWAK